MYNIHIPKKQNGVNMVMRIGFVRCENGEWLNINLSKITKFKVDEIEEDYDGGGKTYEVIGLTDDEEHIFVVSKRFETRKEAQQALDKEFIYSE